LAGGGGGPISGDLLFFTATVPIAVSGVYKEIAFKSVSDMDVWYLNGYVALPQFLIGLLYAPLAAVMTGAFPLPSSLLLPLPPPSSSLPLFLPFPSF
jgi:hypothetical protein